MSHALAPRPLSSRFSRAAATTLLAGAAALAAVPVLGIATPALAHDQLVGADFAVDPADGSVDALRLTFSNSIMEVGTEIVITGPDDSDATDGTPEIDGSEVTQPLKADLSPGDYSAAWRVVSSDGHPIEGLFTLRIAEDGTPTLEDAAEKDPDLAEGSDAGSSGETGADSHVDAESEEDSGTPVGAVIAVVVGGAAVIAGGIAAATVGSRRRARGMAADAESKPQRS